MMATSLSKDEIKKIQQALQDRGFYTGPIDGDYGPKTKNAVFCYQDQRSQGNGGWMAKYMPLKATGDPDKDTLTRLNQNGTIYQDGAKGEIVKLIQNYLICCGLKGNGELTVTGMFDQNTTAAVRAFQKLAEIEVDGKAGRETFAELRL
jgi:peptidoglycan hydrolase-like protein with peptidoglycan-binding domain